MRQKRSYIRLQQESVLSLLLPFYGIFKASETYLVLETSSARPQDCNRDEAVQTFPGPHGEHVRFHALADSRQGHCVPRWDGKWRGTSNHHSKTHLAAQCSQLANSSLHRRHDLPPVFIIQSYDLLLLFMDGLKTTKTTQPPVPAVTSSTEQYIATTSPVEWCAPLAIYSALSSNQRPINCREERSLLTMTASRSRIRPASTSPRESLSCFSADGPGRGPVSAVPSRKSLITRTAKVAPRSFSWVNSWTYPTKSLTYS